MKKKRSKLKGQVTRLVDLEVDEVSLVDKPAIGEEIYITKSVKEGEQDVKTKTKVKKNEEENKPAEGAAAEPAQPEAGQAAEAQPAASEPAADPAPAQGEPAEGGEAEPAEGGESDEGEGEPSQPEGDGEVAKRVVALEKNVSELQEMLSTSLDFHEQAAAALNNVVMITMAALEMLMGMSDEDMAEEEAASADGASASTEEQQMRAKRKSLVADIKAHIQKFQTDVQKAGAKISASRLSVLRDIATKLTELISSVSAEEAKGGKKARKKATATDMESLRKQVADLTKSLSDSEANSAELKKTVTEQANRLNEIEAANGGASAGIGDEEEETEESDTSASQPKSKSVFSGLFPVEDIKKRVEKRSEFLSRKPAPKKS